MNKQFLNRKIFCNPNQGYIENLKKVNSKLELETINEMISIKQLNIKVNNVEEAINKIEEINLFECIQLEKLDYKLNFILMEGLNIMREQAQKEMSKYDTLDIEEKLQIDDFKLIGNLKLNYEIEKIGEKY